MNRIKAALDSLVPNGLFPMGDDFFAFLCAVATLIFLALILETYL